MKSILKFSAVIAASLALCLSAVAQDNTITAANVKAFNGVPSAGTTQVETLTIAASTSGGTFTLTVAGGRTTAAITWSATNATLLANVDAALENLNVIGVGGVTTAAGTLTAGIGTITLTYAGKNVKRVMPLLSVSNNLITGGTTPTMAHTTPGVEATYRDAPTGTLLIDYATPDLYINDSTTSGSPTWTKVSP